MKILRKLTKGGLTKSFRGASGGYALNREPAKITLKDVIEIIDGPICLNRCLYDEQYCNLNLTGSCEVVIIGGGITGLSAGIFAQKMVFKAQFWRSTIRWVENVPVGIARNITLMAASTGWWGQRKEPPCVNSGIR